MGVLPEDSQWGDWVLGDLADLLQRAADVLGRFTDVQSVTVAPPREPETFPTITVVVPDERGIFRLRSDLASCEYEVSFTGASPDGSWGAEVSGIRIQVVMADGEPR